MAHRSSALGATVLWLADVTSAGAATTTTLPKQSHQGSPIIGNVIGGSIVLILVLILWRQVSGRRRVGMSGIFSFGRPLPQPKEPLPPQANEPFRDDRL